MPDPVALLAQALDRYGRGECEAPAISEALRLALETAPERKADLQALVDAAHADGRLTRIQQRALAALIRAGGDRGAAAPGSEEPTRLAASRPGGPPADDATRVSSAGAAGPEGDKTVMRRATDVGPPAAEPPETGNTFPGGGDTSGRSTGSGWTHPESWEGPGAEELGPGMTIKGRFVLQEVVGRGGMGVVFRALDQRKEEAQDRNPFVAIKVLNEEFKRHPESLKALQREARKSQSLAHPNVVNVFDFDRDGATVFMTMEFLDGKPLNQLLREELEHGLELADALPIIQGMAQALAYAHKNGVVHSDFKPGNVFLNRDGAVKVFDFGIAQAAKHLDGQTADDHTLFDAGSLGALTPAYASLEMLQGEEPDPRDDLYALGCVAYELLTGRHPFNKLPADEAQKKQLKPAPVRGLSRQQQRALERALAFKREERSPSVDSFLRELTEKRRARWPFALAAVLVLAALGGLAAYFVAPNYVSQRKTGGIISDLRSNQPTIVTRGLQKLAALNQDSRLVVKQQVRPELVAFFKARIADATDIRQGHFDFPKAEALLKMVRALYPDSAELTALGNQLANRRNRLLNQYTRQLTERLLQGHLLASDGKPGIDQVLSTVAQIDPDNPLLHDSRLPFAFARTAGDALAASDFKRAAAIADAGLRRFPDNMALIKARDKARIQLGQVDRESLVAKLRAHVQPALPDLKTLDDFRALRDDAVRLVALAPADPLVADLRARLQPALETALTQAAIAHDWAKAHDMLKRNASLLDTEFLKSHTARLAAAQSKWQARVSELEAQLSSALAQGRLAGPAAPNATTLVAQLNRIDAGEERLRWARASLTAAWLARARAARAAGRLTDAAQDIKAALAQSPGGLLSDALDTEQAAIEQAKKQPVTPGKAHVASLRATLSDALGQSSLEPQKAAGALAILRDLAVSAPGDPLVAKARDQLAAKLTATADAKGKAGDWRGAVADLNASIDLLPESEGLLQALDHARAQLREQSGLARLARVREQQKAVMDLIARPAFDAAWDKQLHDRLRALASALPAGSQWLGDVRGRVAKLYLQHARELIRSQHFADAEAMLARGAAFADLPDFAAAGKALKDTEATFAAESAQHAQAARIAALKRTLATAAKANDVKAAGDSLAEIKKLLPADDAFVADTAPAAIAAAYARLAARAGKRSKYDSAEKLAQDGLKLYPKDDHLKGALALYRWHSLAQQVEAALGGDQALNQPGIEAALQKLKTGQPDLYPGAEKRFDDALAKSIGRISKTNPAAAQRRRAIARALFPRAGHVAGPKAVAAAGTGATPGGETSPRPCRAALAGYGRRARGTCYDVLDGQLHGPLMVVVPAGGGLSAPVAISKYEISIANYDAYCKLSGQCKGIARGDRALPVTGISFKEAKGYARWLSKRTGYRYRIPSVATWRYAATAAGGQPSSGFNCQVRIGGKLVKGFSLVSISTGEENGWGLVNYVGNAQEWARDGNGVVALGGSYEDPLSKCGISLLRTAGTRPDPTTGFRLVRSLSAASG